MGDIGLLLWGDKELCFGYAVYIGFTNGEYHIVCVDFIAPCGVAPEPTRLSKDEGLRSLHPS